MNVSQNKQGRVCSNTVKYKKEQKWWKFSVVQGNGAALLGMPDIELLEIQNMRYNTIGTTATQKD